MRCRAKLTPDPACPGKMRFDCTRCRAQIRCVPPEADACFRDSNNWRWGDRLAWLFSLLGLERLAKRLLPGCGCRRRQTLLNRFSARLQRRLRRP